MDDRGKQIAVHFTLNPSDSVNHLRKPFVLFASNIRLRIRHIEKYTLVFRLLP